MSRPDEGLIGALAARWWVLLVRGLAAILFGIVAIVMPGPSLYALVMMWGGYAIVDGAFELGLAVQRSRSGARWGWYVFEGLASVAAGVLTFAWPGITAHVLLLVIACWAIVTGVAEIVAAIELRKIITGEWLLALGGALSIIFGALLFMNPGAGALSVVWMIGAYAIVFGVLLSALSFRVKQLGEGGKPVGQTPRYA